MAALIEPVIFTVQRSNLVWRMFRLVVDEKGSEIIQQAFVLLEEYAAEPELALDISDPVLEAITKPPPPRWTSLVHIAGHQGATYLATRATWAGPSLSLVIARLVAAWRGRRSTAFAYRRQPAHEARGVRLGARHHDSHLPPLAGLA